MPAIKKTRKSLDRRKLINLKSIRRIILTYFKTKSKKVFIFDFLIVLAISIVAIVFLYNKFTKKTTWVQTRILISNNEWWWSGEAPKYWLVDELFEGMESYNSFGEVVAKIEDVEIFSLGGPSKQAYLDLSMKVSYDKKRQIYLYNFQPLQKGKPVDLTFGTSNVNGLVVALASDQEERFEKKVRVRMQYLEDWLANSYKVGMEWRDSKERLIARIDDVVVKDTNMDKLVFLNNGIHYTHDIFKDVYLDITIAAIKSRDGEFRFVDGATIKISETLWFHFPQIVAGTQILEILE